MNSLQDVSSEAEETSKTSTRGSEGLATGTSEGGATCGSLGSRSGSNGTLGGGCGVVLVRNWGRGRARRELAVWQGIGVILNYHELQITELEV